MSLQGSSSTYATHRRPGQKSGTGKTEPQNNAQLRRQLADEANGSHVGARSPAAASPPDFATGAVRPKRHERPATGFERFQKRFGEFGLVPESRSE